MIDKQNILITGGNGMVGQNMNFGIKPSSNQMNICDYNSIKNYTKDLKIDYIIHLAAVNLRESEYNIQRSIDVNINGTINIVKLAKELNVPIVYVSSGAVFSTLNTHEKFRENSTPNPNSAYGNTKFSGEMISLLYDKSIIVRTGWLFGGNQKNHYKFVETAINNLIIDKKIYGSIDFFGSPTYVNDFIDKILYLLEQKRFGIFHIINDGYASGFEIGLEICKILNKNTNLILGETSKNIPNSSKFRSNSEILITNYDFLVMRNWKISLREYIMKYFNNYQNININFNTQKIWNNRDKCRLCNSSDIIVIFKLNPTPPANSFIKEKIYQECMPLDLCKCNSCNHIQLLQIVDPKILFENYLYISSASLTMTNHLIKSVSYFIEYLKLDKFDKILEIGANDGTCIKYLLENGFSNTIGIDPAKNIKERNNLPIICDFFGSNCYDLLNDKYGKFKLIFGFHCCAHIENIQDVFKTIYNLLDDDGVFVMEVGYFYEVFKNKTFDTIYHEHIDYYTCTAVKNYCDKNNFNLFDAFKTNIQGGSIQFFIAKNISRKINYDNINQLLDNELKENLFDNSNLINWSLKINQLGQDLNYLLKSIKLQNKIIAGYGASAKSTTFMYHFGISNNILDFIIDENIYKLNHYTPGLHIPIKSLGHLNLSNVDYIIILSWNFIDDILKKLEKFRESGLKIIIPFPNIQIV